MRDFAVFVLGACVGFGVAKLLQEVQEKKQEQQIENLTTDIDKKLQNLEEELARHSA